MRFRTEKALTFDDVLLVPQYSKVVRRSDVDTTTNIVGPMAIPIVSANMDTITDYEMAQAMYEVGGLGILHRYAPIEFVVQWVEVLKARTGDAVPSIGVKEEDLLAAKIYLKAGATAICVDVAHGHHENAISMVKEVRKLTTFPIIAGNVATYDGAVALVAAGANIIKVGVGPGSVCTTRIVTGHGIPQLTAIMDVAQIKNDWPNLNLKVIADGGIRYAGDIVKALAAGADAVMVGHLLAGTDETPGEAHSNMDGSKYKSYRGMASKSAQLDAGKNGGVEGVSMHVPTRGPVAQVIASLMDGVRSGFSYSGACNIHELQANAEFVRITHNGMAESHPHGVK